MMPLALILIAVSLLDWLALFPRTAPGRPGSLAIIMALSVAAAAVMNASYGSWVVALITFFTLLLGALGWSGLRNRTDKGGWLAIAALVAMLAIGALIIPAVANAATLESSAMLQHIASYLDRLPWHQLGTLNPELLLLTLGLLLFLGPTANAVVKSIMIQIRSSDYEASEQQLKGGRYIGPLERWLIFGLALAGQPTAAALVISAKSIIRFPELQSKAGRSTPKDSSTENDAGAPVQQIDELTEYFLIGSLLSWLLALVAALPVAATRIAG